MREEGFEPSQALSHTGLNRVRLTTPALPPRTQNKKEIIKFSLNLRTKLLL